MNFLFPLRGVCLLMKPCPLDRPSCALLPELKMSWWYGCFPPEFFRYERTPKGGPKCTLFLSLCIAGASVSTFITLAVKGANISTVESEVSAFDKSGTNGWSCDMVSKVTDEYSLDTNEGTSFTLVNVLETATECTENLKAVSDPCSGLSYAMTASPTFRGTSSLFVTDYASGDFIFLRFNALLQAFSVRGREGRGVSCL